MICNKHTSEGAKICVFDPYSDRCSYCDRGVVDVGPCAPLPYPDWAEPIATPDGYLPGYSVPTETSVH